LVLSKSLLLGRDKIPVETDPFHLLAGESSATLIASITIIRATTLNNNTMRFFMRVPFY
jgi:hypothetical protein